MNRGEMCQNKNQSSDTVLLTCHDINVYSFVRVRICYSEMSRFTTAVLYIVLRSRIQFQTWSVMNKLSINWLCHNNNFYWVYTNITLVINYIKYMDTCIRKCVLKLGYTTGLIQTLLVIR